MNESEGANSGVKIPPVRTEAGPSRRYTRPLVKKARLDSVVRGAAGSVHDNSGSRRSSSLT